MANRLRTLGKTRLHEAANRELAELTTEYKSQEIRLEQLLRDIDPAWTRKELLALSLSASEREVRRISAAFAGMIAGWRRCSLNSAGPAFCGGSRIGAAGSQAAVREEMERDKRHLP